jgi:CubicO group peptidase (beta-lactamase class C family)
MHGILVVMEEGGRMITRRALVGTLPALALAPRNVRAQSSDLIWPEPDWTVAVPADLGLDAATLEAADALVPAAYPDVTGIAVVRHGTIGFERYYGDRYGQNDPVKIRSITKCVIGTLIGMLIDDGDLTLETTIGDVLADRIPAGADPATAAITVRSLLTMTPGWAWDIYGEYERLIAQPDWTAYVLGLPVAYPQGQVFAYNSGASHLLSMIVAAVTGDRTVRFADRRLFGPLSINRPRWEQSPEGEVAGGFGLELTVRELARFGLFALRTGRWRDDQLLSADWFTAATSYQATGDTTGYAAYGYQWWVITDGPYPAYFGLGFGSNYLYIVPDLDLLVVVLKGFETPPNPVSIVRPFIENNILPAVLA